MRLSKSKQDDRFGMSNKNGAILWLTIESPNEDFGRPNQPSVTRFRSTFQGREYSIWVNRKRVRLGAINCAIFCSRHGSVSHAHPFNTTAAMYQRTHTHHVIIILLCLQTHLEITTNARHVKLLMGGSPSETIMIPSSCAGPTDTIIVP
jgi:hypothetical protein